MSKKSSKKQATVVPDARKGARSRNFIDEKLQGHQPSADNFLQLWNFYDRDGNGYLEKAELDNFLHDFLNSSWAGMGTRVSDSEVVALKQTFLEEFDENKDGKISLSELAQILPPSESFFVLFRSDTGPETGLDYMKIWKKYDKDLSGYIEKNELKQFLKDLNKKSPKEKKISDSRLDEYTSQVLAYFDINGDGKLALSELSRMLPANENFVQLVLDKALALNKLNQSDVDRLLTKYDKDGNGTLEGSELTNLVTDILELTQQDGFYNASDVYDLEQAILKGCDRDKNGHIDRKELAVVLLAILRAGADGVHDNAEEYQNRVFQGRKSQHILSYVNPNGPKQTTVKQ